MTSRRWAFVALAASLLFAVDAAAQGRRGRHRQEDPARAEAQEHFEAGNTLMDMENWEAGLLEFQRSLELYPTRAALFNYGMCLKALFRYVEAMETFEKYLADYTAQATPRELQTLNQNIEELRRLLGDVGITVSPPGATVAVDGTDVGVAPLAEPIRVVSGRHTVTARLDGFHDGQAEIAVTAGEHARVEIKLREIERIGTLRVEANVPGAEVWVDGAYGGPTPYQGTPAEGNHEVRVTAEGYVTQVQEVSIAFGDERTINVTLSEPAGTDPLWFWSTVGLMGAALVTTVALGATVVVKDGDFNNARPPTDDQYDEGRNLVVATDLCLGITLAAAVAAGVLAFTTNWGGEEAAPVDMAPALAPTEGGVGLAMVGRF
ncbi:MAG: PEGA domain-containing protein [Myxococcota bacterium]|nr:PEGA domain-containing protein [Myxococcota bacterium]